jgi:hypothetical protein
VKGQIGKSLKIGCGNSTNSVIHLRVDSIIFVSDSFMENLYI